MLPSQLDEVKLDTEVEFGDYPTLTYYVDAESNQIRGSKDGLAAMKQAVEIIMGVERYKFQIYTPNFGIELTGLIGNEAGYVSSELKRRITDALFPDRRVIRTMDFTFHLVDTDSLVVRYVVETVYGNFPAEMEVSLQ